MKKNIKRYVDQSIYLRVLYDRLCDTVRYLTGGRPVRREATKINPPPFFIVGSGRSGNTLLRAILTAHTDISIPPESYVLAKVIRRYRVYSFLRWPILTRLVLGEFEYHDQFEKWDLSLRPVYHEIQELAEQKRDLALILDGIYRRYITTHMPEAVRWGDKTPVNTLHLDWIDPVFPEAKYIHMVRDGRDVVSSYLQSGIYSSVEGAAERWKESVKRAHDFGEQRSDRYLEVRYENLTRSPRREAKRVCAFLNVGFSEEMLRFQDDVDDLGDTDLSHHRGLRRPINTSSIGKWKKRLSNLEQTKTMKAIGDVLEEFGYNEA